MFIVNNSILTVIRKVKFGNYDGIKKSVLNNLLRESRLHNLLLSFGHGYFINIELKLNSHLHSFTINFLTLFSSICIKEDTI